METLIAMRTGFSLRLILGLAICACAAGCGTINEKLTVGMADYMPQWAGGLPADAPPRPGSPKYDAWQREMERRRQMPAAQRTELEKTDPSGLDPVH